jgi:hypothetical protein
MFSKMGSKANILLAAKKFSTLEIREKNVWSIVGIAPAMISF